MAWGEKLPKWAVILFALGAGVGAVLMIMNEATRPQFMFEESLQTVMFASWMAADAEDWTTFAYAVKSYAWILGQAELFTRWIGWINPLAAPAYRAYWQSGRVFLAAMQARLCTATQRKEVRCYQTGQRK